MLYEVAMILKPTKKESENGKLETLILAPTPLVAKDEKSAGMMTIMQHNDLLKDIDIANVEVIVRPFA